MGIPAYFSYIVKNHPNIIKHFNKNVLKVNNIYLDCNSIIYDVVYSINSKTVFDSSVHNYIIMKTIEKIEEYINIICPDNLVFIAFDGVAPLAKLEQQRERRYKSWYQAQIKKELMIQQSQNADIFNTTAITPGTIFMSELNNKIKSHFKELENKFGVNKIIVSPSDESGEGEHKLFRYIRSNLKEDVDSTNVIYGLDADLIMLSINHLPINPNIYLFRETPEFIKSINSDLEPSEKYVLDIPELARIITLNMNNNEELDNEQKKNRIYDYIFLCFFLGNDFMPHFPAINIRTGGIDKMLNAYKHTIGSKNKNLTDGKNIFWANLRELVSYLSSQEENYIKTEMKQRDRKEKFYYPEETGEEKFKKFEALPNYERSVEKFINPFNKNWEKRYYKALFDIDVDDERKKQICTNYLEGLEWTMKYYTTGCPDWRWKYNYSYPPLLKDLLYYMPYFSTVYISENTNKPVNQLVQLSYVLPKPCLNLLPTNVEKKIMEHFGECYDTNFEFLWAYCKYFWESHVKFPEIDIDKLEKLLNNMH